MNSNRDRQNRESRRNERDQRANRESILVEQLGLEYAKETRVDGSYSRKVNGKQLDRMKAERSKNNRRKSRR